MRTISYGPEKLYRSTTFHRSQINNGHYSLCGSERMNETHHSSVHQQTKIAIPSHMKISVYIVTINFQ